MGPGERSSREWGLVEKEKGPGDIVLMMRSPGVRSPEEHESDPGERSPRDMDPEERGSGQRSEGESGLQKRSSVAREENWEMRSLEEGALKGRSPGGRLSREKNPGDGGLRNGDPGSGDPEERSPWEWESGVKEREEKVEWAPGRMMVSNLWRRRHRQMVQTHFYRMASKMFGSPKCRLRIITAMPVPAQSQPRLWPQQQVAKMEEVLSGTVSDEAVWGVADYIEWLLVRKRQRRDLELMANVKRWINSKISANDLELHVLETLENHEWRNRPWDKTHTLQRKPESKLHHHMDLTEEFLLLTGEEHSMACHSLPTPMGGEMGEATNVYRQRCLMEYKKILQTCENYGISFTERMLEKALLHPGDKLKPELYLKLRQPGTSVLPAKHVEKRHFIRRQIASDQLNRELAQGKGNVQMEIGREKNLLREVIEETGTKLRVSKTRRGCWKGKDARALSPSNKKQQMMLDDYVKYTRKLKMKLQPLTGLSPNIQANPRAFWPGHTLDKVHMHLPNVQLEHKDIFFSSTHEDTRLSFHNYQIDKGWPISNQGYLTYGDIKLNKRYWL